MEGLQIEEAGKLGKNQERELAAAKDETKKRKATAEAVRDQLKCDPVFANSLAHTCLKQAVGKGGGRRPPFFSFSLPLFFSPCWEGGGVGSEKPGLGNLSADTRAC